MKQLCPLCDCLNNLLIKEQVFHLYSLMAQSRKFPGHTGHSAAQSRWLCRDTGPRARRTQSCWTLVDRSYKLPEKADVKPPNSSKYLSK